MIVALAPSRSITLGEVTLELLREGERWIGIGAVSVGDFALRSPRLPWGLAIRSPDGVELEDWRVVNERHDVDGSVIELSPHRRVGGPMEWMLHAVRSRQRIADWATAPAYDPGTIATLRLAPLTRLLAGRQGLGFSYQWNYRSRDLAIHRLLDRGSWEPGGAATGNEVWLRNSFAPARYAAGERDEHCSSEWWLGGLHNPDVFQFIPWQTGMQGFTFTIHAHGVLVTWARQARHIRSLFEKQRGSDELLHLHEHCDDLATALDTSPVEVLWFPGATTLEQRIDLYEAVRTLVWNTLHADAGLRREWNQPYGVIEGWGLPDLDRDADEVLPQMAAHGCRWVMVPNHFANNMNVWGVGNMCCTVDLKIPESVGADHLRRFCASAKGLGMQVEMWGNTAYSTLTWIFSSPAADGAQGRIRHLEHPGFAEAVKAAPQAWCRNPSGAIEADHYTPVFAQTNLREPAVTAYWHAAWRDLHEQTGVDGIFLDSSSNLSSDKFHWVGCVGGSGGATSDQTSLLGRMRPAVEPQRQILSQYRAHLALIAAMQGYGYRYAGEDTGLFGINRSGPSLKERLRAPWLWSESLCLFDHHELPPGSDPREAFFTGMAWRILWFLYWDFKNHRVTFACYHERDERDRPDDWHRALLIAYSAVECDMRGERTCLSDGAGVLYRNGIRHVLWALRDGPMPAKTVRDVLTGELTTAISRLGVYSWESA